MARSPASIVNLQKSQISRGLIYTDKLMKQSELD